MLADFLPVDVSGHRWSRRPSATGLLVGLWVALVFALRPLVALRNVSPLQTLRRESDAEALRGARFDPVRVLVALVVVFSVAALGVARAEDPRQGLAFSAAIGARGRRCCSPLPPALSASARRVVRPSWPFVLRQGVASLYRPGNQTRAVVLALGFGVFLMSTVYQVQHNLLRSVDVKLDASRANVVFFDVQEDQGAPLDSLIRAQGYAVVQRTPIVPMKIAADQRAAIGADHRRHDARAAARRAGWAMRREFRSTFRDEIVRLGEGHRGPLPHRRHRQSPALPEVSVDVARRRRSASSRSATRSRGTCRACRCQRG